MQNRVFVLDTANRPLDPCHPARARKLLKQGKAAVYRRYPFTIILQYAVDAEPAPGQLKVDPGSKTTGMVIVQHGRVIWAAELDHRGQKIKLDLAKRRAIRRGRRTRKTRYRQPRFDNRTRPKGWLAPSLKSRVDNLQTWFIRLSKICPLEAISMELVRFDTQLMANAEVSGVEYQQGELAGYEVRAYLLEKFGRRCSTVEPPTWRWRLNISSPNRAAARIASVTFARHADRATSTRPIGQQQSLVILKSRH